MLGGLAGMAIGGLLGAASQATVDARERRQSRDGSGRSSTNQVSLSSIISGAMQGAANGAVFGAMVGAAAVQSSEAGASSEAGQVRSLDDVFRFFRAASTAARERTAGGRSLDEILSLLDRRQPRGDSGG